MHSHQGYRPSVEDIVNNAIFDSEASGDSFSKESNFTMCEHHCFRSIGGGASGYIQTEKSSAFQKRADGRCFRARRLPSQEKFTTRSRNLMDCWQPKRRRRGVGRQTSLHDDAPESKAELSHEKRLLRQHFIRRRAHPLWNSSHSEGMIVGSALEPNYPDGFTETATMIFLSLWTVSKRLNF